MKNLSSEIQTSYLEPKSKISQLISDISANMATLYFCQFAIFCALCCVSFRLFVQFHMITKPRLCFTKTGFEHDSSIIIHYIYPFKILNTIYNFLFLRGLFIYGAQKLFWLKMKNFLAISWISELKNFLAHLLAQKYFG